MTPNKYRKWGDYLKLYPFQKEALDATKDKNKVAYYMDMGLG
jgi:hypothetical protein